jgi:hypothetical protein
MKLNPFNSPAYLIPAFALMSLPLAHATDFVWDGATTGNWSTITNWDTDTAPDNTGIITIGSGNNVNYDVSTNFLANATLNLDGELSGGLLRFNGSTFNVGSTGIISGGFKDLNNATLNFQDGAQFTATYWEQKGTNVFDFELSSTGFTALTPTNFANSTSPTTPNTTYTADLASYSGATQDVTLVDFGVSALDNATFTGGGQYTLSIDNTGTNAARLYYDDATEAVKLSINETVTWTGSGGDGKLSTAANWDTPDGKAPIANDTLLINNGATVAHEGALLGNSTINLEGSTLTTEASVIRLNNATINVDATSSLTGGFWDLDGASIVFEDGALANMANWEQKDLNSFTYVLGTSDFLTLTPGAFRLGNQPGAGLTGSMTNATYIVDFTNFVYELGSKSIILMDFSSDATNMSDATFQTASFNYINIDEAVTLQNLLITWSDAENSMTLTFDVSVVPEPGTYALLGGLLALGYVMLRRRR